MGLRNYLMKRTFQTVVTLIVVLILMFVLFRLMPGDPTIFFIQPGSTPEQRDTLRVAYGFARWEPAPGVFQRGSYATPISGFYALTIDVKDSAGTNRTLYAAYVLPKVFPPTSPITIREVTTAPSQHVLAGTTVILSAQVLTSTAADPSTLEAWALVTAPGGTVTNVSLAFGQNEFQGTYVTGAAGTYATLVEAFDPATGNRADVRTGFAANVASADLAPLVYVEDEDARGAVFTAPSPASMTSAQVYVIVTSGAGSIESVAGTVVQPDGSTQTLTLSHPLVAVPLPEWEQLWYYLVGMLTGNFGNSFTTGRPVGAEIAERVGPTLLLFGTATILSVALGIVGGVLLGWFRGSKGEIAAIVGSLFFYSMPIFWFGIILLYMFAFTWQFFPKGGYGCVTSTGELMVGLDCSFDILAHMVLPLLTLVIVNVAFYILLMRNSLLEVLGEDFITVAKAKGLKDRKVMYKHAARNAMLPVTTVVAIAMATVISGGVLTETVFSWPGMGYYFITRTLSQDYPAVQAAFFILALLTIIGNVVADVAYAYLDPRVRL